MRLKDLVILAILVLALLGQHNRLQQLENQVNILSDLCQIHDQQLADLLAGKEPVQEKVSDVSEMIRKFVGYFDDHDVSGLLEDD